MFIAERQGFEPRVPRGAKVRFYFKTAILLGEKKQKTLYFFS